MTYIVNVTADASLKDVELKICYIYSYKMVDEDYCGDLGNTLSGLEEGAFMENSVTNAFKLFFAELYK